MDSPGRKILRVLCVSARNSASRQVSRKGAKDSQRREGRAVWVFNDLNITWQRRRMAISMAISGERMAHTYSIAEARDNLAKIVRESESGPVELTRRGRPVAVLVSLDEFERLQGRGENFWQRLVAFRQLASVERFGIDEDVFAGVRDRDTGRKAPW